MYRKPPKNLQDLESKILRAWENLDLSKVNRCTDRFKDDCDNVKMQKAAISNENVL